MNRRFVKCLSINAKNESLSVSTNKATSIGKHDFIPVKRAENERRYEKNDKNEAKSFAT